MKRVLTSGIVALSLSLFTFNSCTNSMEKEQNQGTKFETVEGDPLNVKIYTLKNGLKVYISENHSEPRIYTSIAVGAGSKNDPSDCTGLAHYLEHMLFKGTSRIGTLNWDAEKVALQRISDLYEEHKATTDPEKKKAIYAQIDSISFEAAKYTVPNEFDKLISSLGAKGTNAYTSNERTVYINDIPSNEFSKWAQLESNRMNELVLRLFHTELETVYEEYNRGLDNDYSKHFHAAFKALFPKHQYGTQTTIGEGEHLKNPSMEKIHEFYNTYYVPNNMAICLSGDVDPEFAVAEIEKYFGAIESKDVPAFTAPKEDPITEVREVEVVGPMNEWVSIWYRANGATDKKTALYLPLISNILSNGTAGLMDLNLNQTQKVINAGASDYVLHDYSVFYMTASPKQGQQLEEVRELLTGEINKLKNGEFEDWVIEAVVNNIIKDETNYFDFNNFRNRYLVDAFILKQDWADVANRHKNMMAVTKEEIVAFANDLFKDNNYVVVYKRNGEDKSIEKVDKPQITPLEINRTDQSEFALAFDSIPSNRLAPIFNDYNALIQQSEVSAGLPFYHVANENSDLFYLYYVWEMGSQNDPMVDIATQYFSYLGTDSKSAEEIKKEFYKLGIEYNVYVDKNKMYLYLYGLQSSFDEGTALFEQLWQNAVPNDAALAELKNDTKKKRDDNKKSKYYIQQGLINYARYGAENPFNSVASNAEIDALTGEQLIEKVKGLRNMKHSVYYYGKSTSAEVLPTVQNIHKVEGELAELPAAKTFAEKDNSSSTVYFTNYDMVQAEIQLTARMNEFNKDNMPFNLLFNQYFGSGLSSIVFQEIREAKALAYSAYCYIQTPIEADKSFYLTAYVGTQVDKLNDAVAALTDLMNDMPEAENQFEDAKISSLKRIETDRSKKRSIFFNYLNDKRLGFDYDLRKDYYESLKNIQMGDLKTYFNNNIKGKTYNYAVVGNEQSLDFKVLEQNLGKVEKLSLEQIFGY